MKIHWKSGTIEKIIKPIDEHLTKLKKIKIKEDVSDKILKEVK